MLLHLGIRGGIYLLERGGDIQREGCKYAAENAEQKGGEELRDEEDFRIHDFGLKAVSIRALAFCGHIRFAFGGWLV